MRRHKKAQFYALDGVLHEALNTIRKIGFPSTICHQWLGHPNSTMLSLLKKKNVIDVSHWMEKPNICISFQMGKSCRLPFKNNNKIFKSSIQKIHYDLWRPTPIISNQGFWYYAIFIDDFSRFTWLCPLKWKSDFLDCFIKSQRLVENQFNQKINVFQCNEGGKFNSNSFIDHIQNSGIELHISCWGTPQQNGVAEWKHRHLVETGCTM